MFVDEHGVCNQRSVVINHKNYVMANLVFPCEDGTVFPSCFVVIWPRSWINAISVWIQRLQRIPSHLRTTSIGLTKMSSDDSHSRHAQVELFVDFSNMHITFNERLFDHNLSAWLLHADGLCVALKLISVRCTALNWLPGSIQLSTAPYKFHGQIKQSCHCTDIVTYEDCVYCVRCMSCQLVNSSIIMNQTTRWMTQE